MCHGGDNKQRRFLLGASTFFYSDAMIPACIRIRHYGRKPHTAAQQWMLLYETESFCQHPHRISCLPRYCSLLPPVDLPTPYALVRTRNKQVCPCLPNSCLILYVENDPSLLVSVMAWNAQSYTEQFERKDGGKADRYMGAAARCSRPSS